MSRFSRINTIWRKELIDTLRDRRTLIAMVLVPLALYPALIVGSLQGFELQISRLKQERYDVVVASDEVQRWLRQQIDADIARRPGAESRPAEEAVARAARGELPAAEVPAHEVGEASPERRVETEARRRPPEYDIYIVPHIEQLRLAVLSGQAHVGLLVDGDLPAPQTSGSAKCTVLMDQTEIRSQIAAAGLESILERAGESALQERLKRAQLDPAFIRPIEVIEESTAPPEKVGGSILGQIVPLILIVMTITGAIYPAIDLTAGERERGTLETLMVAPVPTVDLIAGKFVVVALIGMLSAALNLVSIGGTIWLGGLGDVLTRGGQVVIPLGALPWVLLVLIPLAVMFSALLLAVCSFARSFKEAQNYVMPVLVAALIPAVIGILPGTRLDGPLLVMPVTNIVILTRDLFTGKFELGPLIWVTVSTTLYAGAAVAVAARLFGQEAVLFADSGSVKTLFQRRFIKASSRPTAAQAFLLLALVFSLNFFAQQTLVKWPGLLGTMWFWIGWTGIIVSLFVLLPIAIGAYTRVRLRTTFALAPPPARGMLAALCLGLSTWLLARAAFVLQNRWLPLPPEMAEAFEQFGAQLDSLPAALLVVFVALVPGVCEELFFRGYALSGLRRTLGPAAAVTIAAVAFGVNHHSVFRLAVTTGLGLLFGLLVVRTASIWPAMLAHLMHNGLSVLAARADGLKPWLERIGLVMEAEGLPPWPWLAGAAGLAVAGVLVAFSVRRVPADLALEGGGPSGENGIPIRV